MGNKVNSDSDLEIGVLYKVVNPFFLWHEDVAYNINSNEILLYLGKEQIYYHNNKRNVYKFFYDNKTFEKFDELSHYLNLLEKFS